MCDGSAISRTTYAELFNVIGTTYGVGDGSTTFNVPDFKNKTFWGGNSSSVGTVKEAGLPNITGDNGVLGERQSSTSYSGALYPHTTNINNKAWSASTLSGWCQNVRTLFDASKSNSIYGNSTTVQPPALVVQVIIKYK